MTYTYAIMHVSQRTYEEIAEKMRDAGWTQAFHQDESLTSLNGQVIDMSGTALALADEPSPEPEDVE